MLNQKIDKNNIISFLTRVVFVVRKFGGRGDGELVNMVISFSLGA